jgi:cell wall-associated NlpC family hydrolase
MPIMKGVNDVPSQNKVSYFDDILTTEFWLRKVSHPDKIIMSNKIIMSKEQIDCFNQEIQKRQSQIVRDLAVHHNDMPGDSIQSAIKQTFPQKHLYHQGQQLEKSFYDDLLQEMNVKGLKKTSKVQFAYSIRGASIRSFPSKMFVTDNPSDNEFDLFQETALDPAEPVIILHESKSGEWSFVQTSFFRGWVPAADLAVAGVRHIWLDYLQTARFLVVTGSKLRLGYNPYSPEISELEFMMGAKIPLTAQDEVPDVIDNQSPEGCYVVKLPVQGGNGELTFKQALVPRVSDVSVGYLPYTRAAVIRQAFKMQGERYGWGGLFKSRDCSAFVRDIYRCFGFHFPRNSGEQMLLPGKNFSLTGANRQERRRLLDQLPSGSLLFFPGHVMLYLGKHKDDYYVIHAIAYYGEKEKRDIDGSYIPVSLNAVAVSPLSLRRHRSGEELMMALTSSVQI